MPTDSFEIGSYTVATNPRGYHTYRLVLASRGRSRAHLYLAPAAHLPDVDGWVYNAGGTNFDDTVIMGYANEKHFEAMHHVLQTEDPVTFNYGYFSGNSTAKRLFNFELVTGEEPTGEGMADAAITALVAAGELDLESVGAERLGVENLAELRPNESFAEDVRAALEEPATTE